MARQRVKDLKEVADLSKDMTNAFATADASMLNLLAKVGSVSDGLQSSNKYSEKNVQAAKETVTAMKSIVDLAQENTKENRQAVEAQARLVLGSKNLERNQRDLLKGLLDEAEARNDNVQAANALNDLLEENKGTVMITTGLVGGLAAGFASAVALAKAIGAEIDKIGDTFGAIAAEDNFRKSFLAAGAEATRLGFGVQDVLSVTDALTSKFGAEFTPQVAKSAGFILDFAKGTGLSNDEATNLIGAMTAVTDLTIEQAAQLSQGVFNLARQANVAPTAVMKDLANAGEAFAKFSGGSVENLAKAAVQARALGSSIDQVANAARGTLDFQSSLQAELEASVLLGRTINLQKAREAAQSKDLVGFQNEILKQLGDQQQFLNAPIQAQEALAKATGFSVQQIAELLDNSEKVESLSSRLAQGPGFAQLVGEDALSNVTEFLNKIKQIGATILSELAPYFEGISEKLVGIVEDMGGAEGIAKKIAGAISVVAGFFAKIANNLPTIIGFMVTLKGLSIAFAVAQSIAAIAQASGKTFGVGALTTFAGIAAGASAVAGLIAGYMTSFHDLEPGKMVEAGSPDTPVNITQGEVIMHKRDIPTQGDVTVHTDNSDVVEAIEKMQLSVKVSRSDLEFILNSGI